MIHRCGNVPIGCFIIAIHTFHSGMFVFGGFHLRGPTGGWAYGIPLKDNIRLPPLVSSMYPQYIPLGVCATGNSHLSPPGVMTFTSPSSWVLGSGLSPPAPAPSSGWGLMSAEFLPVLCCVVSSGGSVPWRHKWMDILFQDDGTWMIAIIILSYILSNQIQTYMVRIYGLSVFIDAASTRFYNILIYNRCN